MTSFKERLSGLRNTQDAEEVGRERLAEQKKEEVLQTEEAKQEMLEQIKQELIQRAESSFIPILKKINEHYLNKKGEIRTEVYLHGEPDDPFYKEVFSELSNATVSLEWTTETNKQGEKLSRRNLLIMGGFLDNSIAVQGGSSELNIHGERLPARLDDEQWKSAVEEAALRILENKSYAYVPYDRDDGMTGGWN